ncbi:hypothetical protein MSG28_015246 [Choristoneura fumiferana]|uniref:Uncharacterized protein n=1 Tax=Choristoneura fumiferana TaxID=7141 RepID=A0ACC0KYR5_CHOFU|nr:hypothetical protein MSG28_015246 [Choristoneura fumiferana]
MTNNEADYELCFRAENVVLPRGGHFGLSAATGGLADDHDVVHLLTTSLHSTQQTGQCTPCITLRACRPPPAGWPTTTTSCICSPPRCTPRSRPQTGQCTPCKHFGLSAATGGLADDHDVVHLLTTSLHSTQQTGTGQQMSSAEQQKLSQEYQDYQKKLDQQKEDYRKDHPDEVRDKDGEFDDWFESDGQRELRQIFQGQGQIHDVLRDLHKKVDEVIGKQMNSLSMLSAVYSQSQGQPVAQLQPGQAPPVGGALPVGRHEWEALAANNQLIINTVAELKSVSHSHTLTAQNTDSAERVHNRGVPESRRSGGGGGGGAINPQFLAEMRDGISKLQQGVNGVAQRLTTPINPGVGAVAGASCPEPGCVGLTALLLVVALQLALMFLYNFYKERKEAQAKKFF